MPETAKTSDKNRRRPPLPPERAQARRANSRAAPAEADQPMPIAISDQQIEGEHLRRRIHLAVLLFSSALVSYLAFRILQPFLPIFSWAVAIAIVAYPLDLRILGLVKRPGAAAAISTAVVALAFLGPVSLIVNTLLNELAAHAALFDQIVQGVAFQNLLTDNPGLASSYEWAERTFGLQQTIQGAIARMGQLGQSAVSGSLWSLAQFGLVLFTVFFLFRDRPRIMRTVRSLLPLPREDADRMFVRVSETVHATIYGSLLVASIQGLLAGCMLHLLGVEGAVLWGSIMGLLALIPYLGTFVVWAPVAAYMAITGDWARAAILAGWGLGVVATIDNLLYPIFVGSRLRFHTLPVFFFILGGVAFFGAAGLVLGPLTLAVSDALLDIWRNRFEEEQPA